MNEIIEKMKWFGSFAGTAMPAFSLFTEYYPPDLPMLTLVLSALSAFIIYYAHNYIRLPMKKIKILSPLLLVISITCLLTYLIFFHETTLVYETTEQQHRYQIGFNQNHWTLTNKGRQLFNNHEPQEINRIISDMGGPTPSVINTIWKPYSVISCRLILAILYCLTFLTWTFSFVLMIKKKVNKSV